MGTETKEEESSRKKYDARFTTDGLDVRIKVKGPPDQIRAFVGRCQEAGILPAGIHAVIKEKSERDESEADE